MNSTRFGRGSFNGMNGLFGSVAQSSLSKKTDDFLLPSVDYDKMVSDDSWIPILPIKSIVADTANKPKTLDEEILNIITSSFKELSKYVINRHDIPFKGFSLKSNDDKSDILIEICLGREVQNVSYDIKRPSTLVYNPSIDMITSKRISEILENKFRIHESMYKNHEYVMTYIAHNLHSIDCYAFTLLYNKLTEEEKQLYQINLNYLISGINDVSRFTLIHETINGVNFLENKCLTDAGENILMMILHNQSTNIKVNEYIALLSSYAQEKSSYPNSINIVTAITDCGKNIFSYANLDYLTVDSYRHLINMGYDVNSNYKKNGKLTNIVYDLFNSLNNSIIKKNSTDIVQRQVSALEYLLPLSETCQLIKSDMKKSTSTSSTIMSTSLDSSVIFKILETINNFVLSINEDCDKDSNNDCLVSSKNNTESDNKYNISILHKLLLYTLRIKNIDINAVDKYNNNILAVLLTYLYNPNTSCRSLYFEHIITSILENFEDIDVNYRTNDNEILLEKIINNKNFELFETFCNHPMINFTNLTSQGSNIGFLLVDKINEENESNVKSRYVMMLMNLLNANKFNVNCLNHEDKNILSYMCSIPNTIVNLQIIKKLMV